MSQRLGRVVTCAAGTVRAVICGALCIGLCTAPRAWAQTQKTPRYDYPTTARADYVIGCLAANGFHRELLDRCSCGIDVIANLMPYDDYEKANTILEMQQAGVGPRGGLFRDTPIAHDELRKLHQAQAEVNLRCS